MSIRARSDRGTTGATAGGAAAGADATFELPPFHAALEAATMRGQRAYMRLWAARLFCSMVAAVCAAFATVWQVGDVEILGLGAAAAFLCALGLEIWMLVVRHETSWYEGRAVAESAKSLAWKYTVGGAPHRITAPDASAGYHGEVEQLLTAAKGLGFDVSVDSAAASAGVTALRAAPLESRREAYLQHRIREQQGWYVSKARLNLRRARRLKVAMFIVEVLGVTLALTKALGFLSIDLSGIAATAISAGAAWLAIRQHEVVARTYAFAAEQLETIAARLAEIDDESVWSTEVEAAEDAMARERSAWHSARSEKTVRRLDQTGSAPH